MIKVSVFCPGFSLQVPGLLKACFEADFVSHTSQVLEGNKCDGLQGSFRKSLACWRMIRCSLMPKVKAIRCDLHGGAWGGGDKGSTVNSGEQRQLSSGAPLMSPEVGGRTPFNSYNASANRCHHPACRQRKSILRG